MYLKQITGVIGVSETIDRSNQGIWGNGQRLTEHLRLWKEVVNIFEAKDQDWSECLSQWTGLDRESHVMEVMVRVSKVVDGSGQTISSNGQE